MTISKPKTKPQNPHFSCGPCTKRPGWNLQNLQSAFLGRSHRSAEGYKKLRHAIALTADVLQIPNDYHIAIIPASNTGAVETALWSLLGKRGVDCLAWENFGALWKKDIIHQLKIQDVRCFEAEYGAFPDLSRVDPKNRDVVFTLNGTTSGVRIPDYDWIPEKRNGLTICDATSGVFAMHVTWEKIDVLTFSWQKILGGEAAHGIIVISPRTIERLNTYIPPWPIPKILNLRKGKSWNRELFQGETLNTPSMLCVEDYIDALTWIKKTGGVENAIKKTNDNANVIEQWVTQSPHVQFLAKEERYRSKTSICISVTSPQLSQKHTLNTPKNIARKLEEENAAYDIISHAAAPPGLRIWCGATVEKQNLIDLIPWLDWAIECEIEDNTS